MKIRVNQRPVDLQMKVGEAGEAYFVEEVRLDEDEVGRVERPGRDSHWGETDAP